MAKWWMAACAAMTVAVGCGTSDRGSSVAPKDDAGGIAFISEDAGSVARVDASVDAATETSSAPTDSGYPLADGGVVAASRFITKVISFLPGDCAGFGIPSMPGIVMGPPVGTGSDNGSLDVVSLGDGGSIVVSFEPNAIVDGPGPDFIVFENPFWIGGNAHDIYAEPGEVSVSDDGVNWTTFPCTATQASCADGCGTCGGWQVVYSNPTSGISPLDPTVAGGLALDLAQIGLTHARYVRVVDKSGEMCPSTDRATTNGFDLDAMAIVNAEIPN